MKKYVVALCLICATSTLLMASSGLWALFFWLVGFLAIGIALLILFMNQKRV